jgi:hypothetical protein
MATIKFSSEEQRKSAQRAAFMEYAKALLKSEFLFGATEEEVDTMLQKFTTDTDNGKYLLIRGIDSRINDNGELTTMEDGEPVVWKNAYVYGTVVMKNGETTKDYFRAPFDVTTWSQAGRMANSWADYSQFAYSEAINEIMSRAKEVKNNAEKLEQKADIILQYCGTLPETFIRDNASTYEKAVKFGYKFKSSVKAVFEK